MKKKNWKEKALHGEFAAEIARLVGYGEVEKRIPKKESEGTILAAQEQALRTNSITFSTDKTSDTLLCRLCGVHIETIRHVTSGCSKLALK